MAPHTIAGSHPRRDVPPRRDRPRPTWRSITGCSEREVSRRTCTKPTPVTAAPSWLGETRNGNWTSRPGTERRRRAVTAPEARRVRPQLEEPRADPAGQGDGRQAGEPRQDREAAGTVGPEAVTKAHQPRPRGGTTCRSGPPPPWTSAAAYS